MSSMRGPLQLSTREIERAAADRARRRIRRAQAIARARLSNLATWEQGPPGVIKMAAWVLEAIDAATRKKGRHAKR